MKKILLLFLGIFILIGAGCASKNTCWYLNGRTNQALQQAVSYCNSYAAQAAQSNQGDGGYYMGYGASSGNNDIALAGGLLALLEHSFIASSYNECMESRGFAPAPASACK